MIIIRIVSIIFTIITGRAASMLSSANILVYGLAWWNAALTKKDNFVQSIKLPADCENLEEIRQGIDSIDQEIIRLLRKRMDYVLSAARFKPNEASIAAPDRVAAMLVERRHWADQQQLSADYIESLFSEIIQWFISQQTQHWRVKHGLSSKKVWQLALH